MITRNQADNQVVHAVDQQTYHSCTVSGFVCSCGSGSGSAALPGAYTGRLIDRLGLGRNFNSVVISPTGTGELFASATACSVRYYGLAVGLQHSATTCSGGFADYSTADWPAEAAFQGVSTATSTGDVNYSVGNAQVSPQAMGFALSTALTTSTSTGYAAFVGYPHGAIPLTGAQRFIRVLLQPHIESTGCGGASVRIGASLVFGHPDLAPATTPLGRVFVTSGCST